MAKRKTLIIDVDKVIESYNKKNPNKPKMTQKSLAVEMGVTNQSVSNWQNVRVPTSKMVYNLERLAEIGQCPISYFITEIDPEKLEAFNNHNLIIDNKDGKWNCQLVGVNNDRTKTHIKEVIFADSFQELLVEIGGKHWLDIMNVNI